MVGGVAALSQQVEDDLVALGLEVIRLAGATRFDTADAIGFEFYGFRPVFLLIEGQARRLVGRRLRGRVGSGVARRSCCPTATTLPQPTLELCVLRRPRLCGPQTSPVACATAEQVAGSGQFGDPDALVAFLEGDEEVASPR